MIRSFEASYSVFGPDKFCFFHFKHFNIFQRELGSAHSCKHVGHFLEYRKYCQQEGIGTFSGRKRLEFKFGSRVPISNLQMPISVASFPNKEQVGHLDLGSTRLFCDDFKLSILIYQIFGTGLKEPSQDVEISGTLLHVFQEDRRELPRRLWSESCEPAQAHFLCLPTGATLLYDLQLHGASSML